MQGKKKLNSITLRGEREEQLTWKTHRWKLQNQSRLYLFPWTSLWVPVDTQKIKNKKSNINCIRWNRRPCMSIACDPVHWPISPAMGRQYPNVSYHGTFTAHGYTISKENMYNNDNGKCHKVKPNSESCKPGNVEVSQFNSGCRTWYGSHIHGPF